MGRDSYEPSFSILQRVELLGNKKIKPVNRRDRFLIDNWKLETAWAVSGFRKNFEERAALVKNLLNLPNLDSAQDVRSKTSTFVPKRLHVGVNSSFLAQYPKVAEKLDKLVHTHFLVPYEWSYNFYPFIEYFILYGKRSIDPIKPNPKQLDLILHKHKELGRNEYTKSDIAFLVQQLRILIGATTTRSTKKQVYKVTLLRELLKLKRSTERPPRNPVLRILCFKVFNSMSKKRSDYLMLDEKQYDQFLKAKTPDLVDEYETFFEKEIGSGYKKTITDEEACAALRRYHPEYKKLATQ